MHLATLPLASDWGSLSAYGRLDPTGSAPICVAVSGGGDSLAALIHTCAWAKRVGRSVLALSVDHGLQPASAAWVAFVARAAEGLGANFRDLAWTGPKPTAGLPAAARAARHALLADAARAAGAGVIVTGHTADDQVENAVMGQGVLRAWSASPAWPHGRGVFLLRPLLETSRADIRADLSAAAFTWIDDPANADLNHARVRARRGLGAARARRLVRTEPEAAGRLRVEPDETLAFPRDLSSRALAFAAVCAGGGARLPRAAEVERIMTRLRAGKSFVATLCGARIEVGDRIAMTREPGRAGLPSLALPPGETVIWDGRYEVTARCSGLSVRPMAGRASKLSKADQVKLRRIDAQVRPGLPLIERSNTSVFCPVLAEEAEVQVRWLVGERYLCAYGTIESERQASEVLSMAIKAPASYVGTLV